MSGGETVHASCILVGSAGILIRGRSGAGKSRLGERILSEARLRGLLALAVADDRVALAARSGRLVASCPPQLSGLWERRGEGIARVAVEPRAVVRLVVDLVPDSELERMPEPGAMRVELCGVELARLAVPCGREDATALDVLAVLADRASGGA
ncbi:serine/threonine protein kinase [Stappia sp. WLB 29]|uniref:HPr kinase/phosphorylase n=1 Tax=Stappia sp. WLB 29 TaxID=2925220 RepID=UPI0020BD8B1E|nr:serine/threonine protein kinase [Stappia sp. WLB 29]